LKANTRIYTTLTHTLLALLVTGAVFTGCKTKNPVIAGGGEPKDNSKDKLTEKQRLDSDFLFYNATKESMLGNYDEAARLYNQCIQINPYNAAAYYELARIAFEGKDYDNAILLGRAAISLDKKNVWYKLLYAQALQGKGKFDEAVKVYELIVKDNPNSLEYTFELADGYLKANRPEDAIKTLDKIENMMGLSPDISQEKMRLYLHLGNIDKAANEIQKLINLNPADASNYIILADMYLANRMNDKAFEVYQKALAADPTNGPVHYSLSQYYREKGDKEKSYDELKLAFASPDIDIDTKIQVLLSYFDLSDKSPALKTQAYELCKLMIDAHPQEPKAYSMYGDFLFRDKKYIEARDNFKKVLDFDNSKYIVWSQLIMSESELGNHEAVYEYAGKALELFPTQPDLYYYKGSSALRLKKYQDAIDVLSDGSGLVYNNPQLELQFNALLGDAYNSVKNYDKSEAYYTKALDIEPQNTYVLNNYSYYLSVRKVKLDKARDMAKLANTIEPNNATYEDTYGWIFYIMGDYANAKTWIEKALSHGGDEDGTVLEHYGDVMYKLGDTAKALEYWKKAKEKTGATDLIDRKITEKKLIE
jgi:tetratricopeptide (TPR) repeat protein